MPFTFAHPAVVVPLARRFPRYFVLSALVVGSMSPDFEYFVYLRPVRTISHDLGGIFLLCMPSGWAVLGLYEHVLKEPMILLLPAILRRRLWPVRKPASTRRWVAVLASLGIGAFSHIVWDSLTHENGWIVERVPMLLEDTRLGIPTYKVLQHGSTVGGLSLLMLWSCNWLRRRPVEGNAPALRESVRIGLVAAMVLIGIGGSGLALFEQADRSAAQGSYSLFVRAVIAFVSSLGIAAFIYSSCYYLVRRPTSRRS